MNFILSHITFFLLFALAFSLQSVCFETKGSLVKAANNTILLDAAKNGLTNKVNSLLTTGSNPNSLDYHGITPLMYASYYGYLAIAQLLLHYKADTNIKTSNNTSFSFGKLLSNKGTQTTALMLAAYAGKLEIVIALLKNGAQVNAQDSDGQNALIYAILGDHSWPHAPLDENRKKIMSVLLDAGADASLADKNGLSAAYYYFCVANLVPGFGNKYDQDPTAADNDPLYLRMK